MQLESDVIAVLTSVLGLRRSGSAMTRDTHLLGAIPELDSMAVVSLITALEERFGFTVEDDEISGATFATVGTLVEFVQEKLAD